MYEIWWEKYLWLFYKSEDKLKFVDVNVCEINEGEKNKIIVFGVEWIIIVLRWKFIVVEEFNLG